MIPNGFLLVAFLNVEHRAKECFYKVFPLFYSFMNHQTVCVVMKILLGGTFLQPKNLLKGVYLNRGFVS